jgi:hypothetical protein
MTYAKCYGGATCSCEVLCDELVLGVELDREAVLESKLDWDELRGS